MLAVSPVIAGRAVKGPTAEMLRQLGHDVSAAGVAALYRDFVDIFLLDALDGDQCARVASLGISPRPAPLLMDDPPARVALARRLLEMIP